MHWKFFEPLHRCSTMIIESLACRSIYRSIWVLVDAGKSTGKSTFLDSGCTHVWVRKDENPEISRNDGSQSASNLGVSWFVDITTVVGPWILVHLKTLWLGHALPFHCWSQFLMPHLNLRASTVINPYYEPPLWTKVSINLTPQLAISTTLDH